MLVRAAHVNFDRVLGDAEPDSNFSLGELFEFAEKINFTGASRERRNGGKEKLDLFAGAGHLVDARPIIYNAFADKIRYPENGGTTLAAETSERQMPGNREEE
jgi:hypothetical protein